MSPILPPYPNPSPLEGHCPGCGAHWHVRPGQAGGRFRCRKCGQIFMAGAAASGDSSVQPEKAPESIPGFQIESELGRGGMGRVYLAFELSTKRKVALKVLLAGREAKDKQRRRFEREVEIAAGLEHPNIARLYSSGLHDQHYWFAMEYVQGERLDKYVHKAGLGIREILVLFGRVCSAIGYAHQQGVIHRDLKPGNILVGANGQPRVLDFGLAKLADSTSETEQTISVPGEVLGTPAYMSPEQTHNDANAVDVRSDVYSLGVILYRLLTRQSPYGEETGLTATLLAIHQVQPPPPRQVRPEIDDDVSCIVMKALEKDPAKRYQNAGEMGRDIAAYLAGEAVSAKQNSQAYLLWKRVARHKAALVGVAAGAIIVLVLVMPMLRSSPSPVADRGNNHEQTPPAAPSNPPKDLNVNVLGPAESAAGWRLLFDGQTTSGWQGYGGKPIPPSWRVADGALQWSGGTGSYLSSVDSFDSFELSLEWRVMKGGNGGVLYRCGGGNNPIGSAPEIQLIDDASPDARELMSATGAVYGLMPVKEKATAPAGEWNKLRLLVSGNHVEHWINDRQVLEYELGSAEWNRSVQSGKRLGIGPDFKLSPRGPIALQGWSREVAYRNIKIRALADPGDVTPRPTTQSAAAGPAAVSTPSLREGRERSLDLGNGVSMKLVQIPAGKFWMGSPETEQGRGDDEARHEVTISKPFYMGVTHVTVDQFAAFVMESGYKTDAEQEGRSTGFEIKDGKFRFSDTAGVSWRSPSFEQKGDHPVVQVSWNDARAFCDWLSKKSGKAVALPTEAQWEYACRAGTTTAYLWGDNPDDGKGWANCTDQSFRKQLPNADGTSFNWDDGFVFTSPVGSFKANAFGLHDMTGNAWQWCQDRYGAYDDGAATDPTGSITGRFRVLRGGSFAHTSLCRVALRNRFEPRSRYDFFGFRVVLDAP